MKKAILAMAAAALVATLVPGNFAAEKHYIITNDDNIPRNSNTATVFEVNTETGSLKQVLVLKTGGTGLGGGYSATPRNAIDAGTKCLFVSDAASSDIAAFTAPGFRKVGNYSNSQLLGNLTGVGLAVSPNGKFLFAGYSASSNIAVWNVADNCSLTLNGNPYATANSPDSIAVTSDGSELVVSLPGVGEIISYAISSAGELTAQPALDFYGIGDCETNNCSPAGVDITNDGKIVVVGAASGPSPYAILTASLSSAGLSDPEYHTHPTKTKDPNNVWFSPAAAKGRGLLYVGMSGTPAGIVTVGFNETPLALKYLNEVEDPDRQDEYGNVQTIGTSGTGSLVAVAAFPVFIDIYQVDSATGALTEISATKDPQATGLITITAFPKRPTR